MIEDLYRGRGDIEQWYRSYGAAVEMLSSRGNVEQQE